jgi:hypothetical protein
METFILASKRMFGSEFRSGDFPELWSSGALSRCIDDLLVFEFNNIVI